MARTPSANMTPNNMPRPARTCQGCGRMVFPDQSQWCDTCYGIYHDDPRPVRVVNLIADTD